MNQRPLVPDPCRCFLAIALPTAVRAQIAAATCGWCQAAVLPPARIRWIAPANLHLTLHFLGQLAAEQRDRLVAACQPRLASLSPFSLQLQGCGAFPSPRQARVLWLGVGDGHALLTDLHGIVTAALAELGLAPEPRPFVPHVSLARLRQPLDLERDLPDFLAQGFRASPFRVAALVLYRSIPQPGGVRYQPLAWLPCAGGTAS
ncbi:MAG: RNA 2',3'-cyclic phosphodiesterase [Desulfuromonas thiophila]|jgi:2'-5' RNA ligase|nr:RNA 2',3'-cyclic phosphodiesterase [Desulfuromonas thiophila]